MFLVIENNNLFYKLQDKLREEGIDFKVDTNRTKAFDVEGIRLFLEYAGYAYTIRAIIEDLLKLYNGEHIFIEAKDGTKIPYSEFIKMSQEELSQKVF